MFGLCETQRDDPTGVRSHGELTLTHEVRSTSDLIHSRSGTSFRLWGCTVRMHVVRSTKLTFASSDGFCRTRRCDYVLPKIESCKQNTQVLTDLIPAALRSVFCRMTNILTAFPHRLHDSAVASMCLQPSAEAHTHHTRRIQSAASWLQHVI